MSKFNQKWYENYSCCDKYYEYYKSVFSDAYVEWVYNFAYNQKSIDDEAAQYKYTGIDKEYGEKLWAFNENVVHLAEEQGVQVKNEIRNEWIEERSVYVRIKDRYFQILDMFGLGSISFVIWCAEQPDEYVEM